MVKRIQACQHELMIKQDVGSSYSSAFSSSEGGDCRNACLVPEGLGDMIVPKNPGDLVTTVEFPPWCCLLKLFDFAKPAEAEEGDDGQADEENESSNSFCVLEHNACHARDHAQH